MGWNPLKKIERSLKDLINLPEKTVKEVERFAESQFIKESFKVAATASGYAIGGPVGGALAAGYMYKDDIADAIGPKFPDMPKADTPDPTATPDSGGDSMDALRRRRRTSGRASTIQAGSLIPETTGKRSLLG